VVRCQGRGWSRGVGRQ